MSTKTTKVDDRSDSELLSAARSDPDNPPREDRAPGRKRSRVFVIRRALKMTEEQFSETFGIPLDAVRDWEAGRSEPDPAARAYLKVIAAEPAMVRQVLA